MDNSNFGFHSIRTRKLNKNPTYQSNSGSTEPKSAPDLPRRPLNLLFSRFQKISTTFSTENVARTGRNGGAIFQSRPRVKFELTREIGKKTSNTGSKGYV